MHTYKKILIIFVLIVGVLLFANGVSAQAYPTATISASPTSVPYGGSSTITWSSTQSSGCIASGDWSGGKYLSGTYSTGPLYSTKTYSIQCNDVGVDFSTVESVTVTVAAPPSPTITSFYADSTSIAYGASTTLHWATSNVAYCAGGGGWSVSYPSGSQSTGALTSTTTYTLRCSDTMTWTPTQSVTVTVAAPVYAPSISSPSAPSVVSNSAVIGANITSNGGGSISDHGICYVANDPSFVPMLGRSNTTCSHLGAFSTGAFSSSYSGLSPNTTYYFTGYATNSVGTSYTTTAHFTTLTNAINGVCSSPATHYTCTSSGASTNKVSGATSWTWTCPGSNGGTNASCTEAKGTSAVTSSYPVANTNVANGNSGGQSVFIPYSSRAFYLYNSSSVPPLDGITVTSYCASGSQWNSSSGTCAATINGSCSPTHYNCTSPAASTNEVSGATSWTWTCPGSNGGTSASCSENKTLPDLTAGDITPTITSVGAALSFSSSISNIGNTSTGASFSNFFQVATTAGGGGTINDLASKVMAALTPNTSNTATSPSYTFTSTGTYSVRACADKTSSAGGGVIAESNEGNNCSAVWATITVVSADTPIDGSCAANHYFCSSPGASINRIDGATSWTWTCPGSHGGSDTSCSEIKMMDNGSCATTHYNCSVGTSVNNAENATSWTWQCNGLVTNASCSQPKTKKPGYKEN